MQEYCCDGVTFIVTDRRVYAQTNLQFFLITVAHKTEGKRVNRLRSGIHTGKVKSFTDLALFSKPESKLRYVPSKPDWIIG